MTEQHKILIDNVNSYEDKYFDKYISFGCCVHYSSFFSMKDKYSLIPFDKTLSGPVYMPQINRYKNMFVNIS